VNDQHVIEIYMLCFCASKILFCSTSVHSWDIPS
jgi:hypothetical protein